MARAQHTTHTFFSWHLSSVCVCVRVCSQPSGLSSPSHPPTPHQVSCLLTIAATGAGRVHEQHWLLPTLSPQNYIQRERENKQTERQTDRAFIAATYKAERLVKSAWFESRLNLIFFSPMFELFRRRKRDRCSLRTSATISVCLSFCLFLLSLSMFAYYGNFSSYCAITSFWKIWSQ